MVFSQTANLRQEFRLGTWELETNDKSWCQARREVRSSRTGTATEQAVQNWSRLHGLVTTISSGKPNAADTVEVIGSDLRTHFILDPALDRIKIPEGIFGAAGLRN